MTYAQLQADIASLVDRTDLAAQIPVWVRAAERHLNMTIQVPELSTYAELQVVEGQVTLPTDLRALQNIQLCDPEGPLDNIGTAELDGIPEATGTPTHYAVQGRFVLLWPRPEGETTVAIRYLGKFPALSDAEPENWLTDNAYDALLYGAALHSAPWLIEDARIPVWRSLRDEAITAINANGLLSEMGADVAISPSIAITADM